MSISIFLQSIDPFRLVSATSFVGALSLLVRKTDAETELAAVGKS